MRGKNKIGETMSNEKNVILVTGATGNVGRQVVSQLLGMGARIRALSRKSDSANLPPEVEVVQGEPSVPEPLEGHLDGIEAVFLVWRALGADAAPFLNAVSNHARRIVFLSSSAVRDDVEEQANPIAKAHADIERLIEKSGLEWTSEEAHREAIERSGQGSVGSGPKWLEVRNFPGIKSSGFKRYGLAQSLISG
jgi:NAD(P)-dependent dehydrogenase (short-subunit alcohol dehydrogenase family)